MKAPFIFTCACAAALVLPFSSCSTQNSSTAGYDTAEPASGEIPPWIAESSDPAYESGHYSPVKSSSSSSSYAYNPPAKPSVSKKSPTRKTTVFVWKLVPETKGKTLEDMTKLWKKKK